MAVPHVYEPECFLCDNPTMFKDMIDGVSVPLCTSCMAKEDEGPSSPSPAIVANNRAAEDMAQLLADAAEESDLSAEAPEISISEYVEPRYSQQACASQGSQGSRFSRSNASETVRPVSKKRSWATLWSSISTYTAFADEIYLALAVPDSKAGQDGQAGPPRRVMLNEESPLWKNAGENGRYLMGRGFILHGIGSVSLCFLITPNLVAKVERYGKHHGYDGYAEDCRNDNCGNSCLHCDKKLCRFCQHLDQRNKDLIMYKEYPTTFAHTELIYISGYDKEIYQLHVQERLFPPFTRDGIPPSIFAKDPNAVALNHMVTNNPEVKQFGWTQVKEMEVVVGEVIIILRRSCYVGYDYK